jgi:hypothetical protein
MRSPTIHSFDSGKWNERDDCYGSEERKSESLRKDNAKMTTCICGLSSVTSSPRVGSKLSTSPISPLLLTANLSLGTNKGAPLPHPTDGDHKKTSLSLTKGKAKAGNIRLQTREVKRQGPLGTGKRGSNGRPFSKFAFTPLDQPVLFPGGFSDDEHLGNRKNGSSLDLVSCNGKSGMRDEDEDEEDD